MEKKILFYAFAILLVSFFFATYLDQSQTGKVIVDKNPALKNYEPEKILSSSLSLQQGSSFQSSPLIPSLPQNIQTPSQCTSTELLSYVYGKNPPLSTVYSAAIDKNLIMFTELDQNSFSKIHLLDIGQDLLINTDDDQPSQQIAIPIFVPDPDLFQKHLLSKFQIACRQEPLL